MSASRKLGALQAPKTTEKKIQNGWDLKYLIAYDIVMVAQSTTRTEKVSPPFTKEIVHCLIFLKTILFFFTLS